MNAVTDRTFQLSEDREAALSAAAEAVAAGECIVLPTDTVYGIGADAFSSDAVGKLLEAKQRGSDMPPPVLIAEPSMLRALATSIPDDAQALAAAHWPGALTLVLKAQRTMNLEIGETGGTVAVRVPDNDDARELLRRTGPLAVSSANLHGQPPAATCADAEQMLTDSVAVYLDGGPAGDPVASTIVDFTTTETGRVLREGAISVEELRRQAPGLEGLAAVPARAAHDDAELEPEVDTPAQVEAPVSSDDAG